MNRERLVALREQVGEFLNVLDTTTIYADALYGLADHDPRDLITADIKVEIDGLRSAWDELGIEWETLEQDHLEGMGG